MARLFPNDFGTAALSKGAMMEFAHRFLEWRVSSTRRPSLSGTGTPELYSPTSGARSNADIKIRSTGAIILYTERNLELAMETANDMLGDHVEHIAYNAPEERIGLAGGAIECAERMRPCARIDRHPHGLRPRSRRSRTCNRSPESATTC